MANYDSNQFTIRYRAASTVPAYVLAMTTPYQVRRMENGAYGDLSPTNGTSTLNSAMPADYVANGASRGSSEGVSCRAVIDSWSGGFGAEEGSALYVTGGGHKDGCQNGVYTFDYSGTTRPTGWTCRGESLVANIPVLSAGGTSASPYPDGRPTSTHSWAGGCLDATGQALFRFGGTPWGDTPNNTSYNWRHDLTVAASGNPWSAPHAIPDFSGQPSATAYYFSLIDKVTRRIFIGGAYDMAWCVFYDIATNTFTSLAKTLPLPATPAYDPDRGQILSLSGSGHVVFPINFAARTAGADTAVTISGLGVANSASLVYDSGMRRYWAFGGAGGSPGWTTLYEIIPNTGAGTPATAFTCVPHTLTGDAIPVISQGGSYNRWFFNRTWRTIGTIASNTSAPCLIRLPDAIY